MCYSDEVHPGNILNSTSRKCWGFYISFLELGHLLSRSDLWFCISILRSSEVATLQAEYSQVFRHILEHIFGDGTATTGVLLKSSKGNLRLHFSLGMLLQDGSAHKQVWANRQDIGSKPCFLCNNIFSLRDAESTEGESAKIFSKFLKYEQLHIATDEEIIASWTRLKEKAATTTQAEFKQLQQASGLGYNHHALLSSDTLLSAGLLKPVSLYCYDYMHLLTSHGVLNDILYQVLESLPSSVKVWQTLASWIQLWQLPKGYNCNPCKLFDAKAVTSSKKAGTFKCSASEMLSIYKLMQYFLQVMFVAHNVMVEQCACFIAWANLLDFLVSIPHLQQPSPRELVSLVEQALQSTVAAGFADGMKPKQHWALHLPDCLRRWSQLPSCFALERKHQQPRKFGSVHCKLQTYEKGLLTAVTMEHVNTLVKDKDLFSTQSHVVEPRQPTKKLMSTLVQEGVFWKGMECSRSCVLQTGTTCKAGDVVLLQPTIANSSFCGCGKVKHFLVIHNLHFCIVDELTFKGTRAGTQSSKWQAAHGQLKLMALDRILQPVVHTEAQDGSFVCLTPAPFSCQNEKPWLQVSGLGYC